MKLFKWANNGIKNLKFWDIGLIKWSVFWFTLMIAKLREPILSLDRYWYGLLFVITAIVPMLKMIKRK